MAKTNYIQQVPCVKIIPDEQTPRVDKLDMAVDLYASLHSDTFGAVLNLAMTAGHRYSDGSSITAVGLAANQCSIDGERVMVRAFMMLYHGTWIIVVDPSIDEYIGGARKMRETCLTWKGKQIIAERYPCIQCSYHTYDEGQLISRENHILSGYMAQIFQHEMNHLDGVEEQVEGPNFEFKEDKMPGRNESCYCGSGRKYKQCCLV